MLNKRLAAISASDAPQWLKNVQKLPVFERFAAELLGIFFGKTLSSGSVDINAEEPALVY